MTEPFLNGSMSHGFFCERGVIKVILLEKDANETARQYAIRVLKHNILTMELTPGRLISENEVGEQLGLSRTPVREAFKDLAGAGMVEIQPQKGTFVSFIDMEMVEEARFLRNVMEKVIINLVCDHISRDDLDALEENVLIQELVVNRGDYLRFIALDDGFHALLFKACGKGRTHDCINSLMVHFDRIRFLNLKEMDMTGPLADHKRLLAAIRERNKASASAEIDRHLSRVLSDKIYLYDLHPEYFLNMKESGAACAQTKAQA